MLVVTGEAEGYVNVCRHSKRLWRVGNVTRVEGKERIGDGCQGR